MNWWKVNNHCILAVTLQVLPTERNKMSLQTLLSHLVFQSFQIVFNGWSIKTVLLDLLRVKLKLASCLSIVKSLVFNDIFTLKTNDLYIKFKKLEIGPCLLAVF